MYCMMMISMGFVRSFAIKVGGCLMNMNMKQLNVTGTCMTTATTARKHMTNVVADLGQLALFKTAASSVVSSTPFSVRLSLALVYYWSGFG